VLRQNLSHQPPHRLRVLELARICFYRVDALSQDGHELDVLADQPPQHGLHPAGDVAEIDDSRAQHLASAEGEELPGEPGRALGSLGNFLDPGTGWIRDRELSKQQMGMADDRGEEIVEVVGDPAGKLADRLHLLRLAKLLLALMEHRLGSLAVGDVGDDAHHLNDVAVDVA